MENLKITATPKWDELVTDAIYYLLLYVFATCGAMWTFRDSNPGPTGYEPATLTAELKVHVSPLLTMTKP